MPYNPELAEELNILNQFNLETTQEGIKVHAAAGSDAVAAAQRLFDKGLTSLSDGGYLTELGRSAAEHSQSLLLILDEPCSL
ncbi:MAG: TIGR02647 family protein [Pseudomonadales bacterium]|nr:TIGR02647 family protein [Pseudomonadales bacterium]